MIKQGEIYLVDFGKKYNSEFGKLRPAVVVQNNLLNRSIESMNFKGIVVIPLTTQLCGGDYRLFVSKREKLKEDSEAVANWICTLDFERFDVGKGALCTLTTEEIGLLCEKISFVMGVN